MKNGFSRGFFITGTDTGIGKTYVAQLLALTFAETHAVTYMKPVQTGCTRDKGGCLCAPDFDYVMEHGIAMSAEVDDHVPYRFEPACSPHLAATRSGVLISLEHIREKYARVSNKKSLTIVEGAGGVLTPLSETTSMIDLMLHLSLPVILVTSPRIGTINHTLLSLEALAKRGMEPAGIVVNNVHEVAINYIYHDTIDVIRDHAPGTALLEVGHGGESDNLAREFCNVIFERR